MDRGRCCICNQIYHGWGNNAQPVRNGRCCDTCNLIYVIPARIGNTEVKEVKDAQRERDSER